MPRVVPSLRTPARSRSAGAARTAAFTLAVAAAIAVSVGTAHGATLFDPALRFRVIATEHFVIYFHQGEERMARRLAPIAEETWRALQLPLGVTPPPRTHVVLADQTEVANAFATPVPYDTVVIYTMWPPGSDFDFDDWLRLAFTHEFTHIVHLDRSEGWARIARAMFGRAMYVFPNLFLPRWQIEGIATYEESTITGLGRLHAGEFRAIVGEAARAGRPEPLDRVNGGVTDWPAGSTPYAYGAGFHDYLARRFGVESLGTLATATARRFPYFSTRAFLYVYGETLGELWRDYQADAVAVARATAAEDADRGITRLTHAGFSTSGPRFDRFVCSTCPARLLYSAANPDGFPSLNSVALDGSPPHQVVTRYLGATTAIGRDTIYFDQTETRRNVGLYSDLYARSRSGGRVVELTSNARLRDPDLSPDGTTLVATQARTGQRDLVTVPVVSGFSRPVIPLVSDPDVYFDGPRWSPDGRSIAAERHRLGAMPEIVVVDAQTRAVRVVASDVRTRYVMPAWRPDGAALVVAAAPEDETFNLVEVAVEGSSMRQLTHTSGGALWPDVSPDGRTIAFAGYTVDGYDIFTMRYPQNAGALFQSARDVRPERADLRLDAADPPTRDYNPMATLAPTSWSPLISGGVDETRIGAEVTGIDVLGYHSYALDATWLAEIPGGLAASNRTLPDWHASYAYDRWRPTLFAAAARDTSFFAGPATAAGTPSPDTRRERTIAAGVRVPFLHTRVSQAAQFSVLRSSLEDTLPTGTFRRTRTPLRAGWAISTAHTYGYSISSERGVLAGGTAEIVRARLGSFAGATTVTADARAYLPGAAPHHVVALRLSGGASSGDAAAGRTFLLGGAEGDTPVISFGSRVSSLLRGFPDATFAGSHVVLANAEYRVPIARPQRGVGTWPFLLHTVHGSVFADAGETWTQAFRASALKFSAGAELSTDVVLSYFVRVTMTGGVAFGHDGAGLVGDRVTGYFRIGRSF